MYKVEKIKEKELKDKIVKELFNFEYFLFICSQTSHNVYVTHVSNDALSSLQLC